MNHLELCIIKQFKAINAYNIDRYLACKIPSNDKCIKEVQFSSISHVKIEKSNSTNVVLANTMARPPTNARKELNRLAGKMSHLGLNDVLWSCLSIVTFRIGSDL